MDFGDEVEAVRRSLIDENGARRRREEEAADLASQAKTRFDAEVKDLWLAAEAHWKKHAPRTDGNLAEWVAGGRRRTESRGDGPSPLVPFLVSRGIRTRSEWEGATVTPIEGASGFKISGWFALCAPGELRELADEYDIASLRPVQMTKVARSYWRMATADVPVVKGDREPTFRECFVSPVDGHDILLSCGLSGLTEIFEGRGTIWRSVGTLREYVVASVAEQLIERDSAQPAS